MDILRQLLGEKAAERASGPKVEVEVTSRSSFVDLETYFETGTHVVQVPEKFLGALEALVESDADAIRAAEAHHLAHRETVLATKKNELSFQPSFEGSFRLLHQRDVRPLVAIKRASAPTEKKKAA